MCGAPFLLRMGWRVNCVRTVALALPDGASPLSPSAGAQAALVFIKEPSSQDALQGRRALLRCEVEAPGPVHVYWLLDGAPVRDTERRFAQGSSLSFAAVDRLQDSGAFQCVARDNTTGEEARSANASFNIKCESWEAVLAHCKSSFTEPCGTPPFPQLLSFPIECTYSLFFLCVGGREVPPRLKIFFPLQV